MKKILLLSTLLFLFQDSLCYAQAASQQTTGNKGPKARIKWKATPFDHQVFIENKGQFDNILPGNKKVFYAAQLGDVWAYFTPDGIIYRSSETPKKAESVKDKDPDKDGPVKPVIHYMKSNWEGANATVSVTADGKRSDYYTYPKTGGGTIKTYIYSKLLYRNIYPGIDIEYTFIKGKSGFKYSLIIHPGADISKAILKYSEASKMKLNNNGDVVFNSPVGAFTDHAPKAAYSGEQGNVDVSYNVSGNTESFHINGDYDKTKTLVIDPWITDPLFTPPYDRAYDIDYDYRGNVYAYGSWNNLQLEKFNSVGAPQWTYNVTQFPYSYYGDLAVNRTSGTTYLTEGFNGSGARVLKIWTNGSYQAISIGNDSLDELWRAVFDPCNDTIILGAGGTNAPEQACLLDTNMGIPKPVNVLSLSEPYHDMVLIATDPSGKTCYMATARSGLDDGIADNVVIQLPVHTLAPTAYITSDYFGYEESNVPTYVGGGSYTANGYDGMAVSPSWLYIYNSVTLKRLNKNTGALVDSIPVSNAVLFNGKPGWGGLAVDGCDDIFLGYRDSLRLYNSSMTLHSRMALPDTVYDILLGQNNTLYACGLGYVCAVNVPPPPSLIGAATGAPSSCSACDGTATVSINCGIAPYAFRWSNNSTNQTDSNMCTGIYTVYVTDASCPPRTDSSIVIINGRNGYGAAVKDTNPGCLLRRGNATAYPFGGTAPYTYRWSNGETNQKDTGLVAGTYTCTITDNTGCKAFVVITLINPTPPEVSIVPPSDSICSGDSVRLTAYGAETYKWSPSAGLSCDSCPNPTARPSVTTTYTIIGSDSNGCTDMVTNTIKVFTTPKPVITGKDSVCSGYTDTLSVTGGTTYKWSTGATTTSIDYHTIGTQTITVTAHNGTCMHDTSFVIHVVSLAAHLTASADSVCPGDSVLLTGGGGITYKWSTGKTSSSIWVNPLTTKTYTLYAYGGTCHDSATKQIKVIPGVTAAIAAVHDTICPHEPTTIYVTGLTGKVNGYKWSTGATTTSITVNDTVTTTYTATLYGICDSVQKTMQVVVIPLPKPLITGTNWKCKGQLDTLSVSSSINPATYLWYNGSNSTSVTIGPINADSVVQVTVSNSLGCSVTVMDTVLLRLPPNPIANPPAIFCAGQPITLTASATGTFPPFNYSWSTGQSGTSIVINPGPDSTTTYTVSVSNGCTGIAVTTVIPNVPILSACCNQTLLIEHDSANRRDTAILVAQGNSIKYQWEQQPTTGTITCLDPLCDSVMVITDVSTTYTVIGTDSNGCQTEQLLLVTIDIPCFDLTIPNVFTPTNPGILGVNNEFYIRTQNISAWDMTIFDRWGKEMYHSTDQYQYWNGNTEGGAKASAGVYYYIINATCQNTTYKKDGFVQLIR